MKKATIKRRKRVIPANEEDEDEDSDMKDAPSPEKTPERGTTNDDGSVNLGFRRRAPDASVKHEPSHQTQKPPSPYGGASTLAAYHQGSPASHRQVMGSLNDENRLPPLTSMASGGGSDRQMSRSPGSFMSPSRKRSFSTTESESAVAPSEGYETSKRISSIKDILNPSAGDDHDLALPPLRSPGLAPTPSSGGRGGSQPPGSEVLDDTKQKRSALEQETERIRQMLAAKEKELLAMGRD